MMKKRFDCVEMKHEAAQIVQAKLAAMSREEKIEYFRVRTQELRDLQARLIAEREAQRKTA
jgi:hypothetical protein